MDPLTREESLMNTNLLLRRQLLQNEIESFVNGVAAARGVPGAELVIHTDGRLERRQPAEPPVTAPEPKKRRRP